jgi:2-polyprenyl-3-methyl-5-hydroxy-6-metoxy-1,4-benzoquinol methylase
MTSPPDATDAEARDELARRLAAVPYWYHRIALPFGLKTPGWAPLAPEAYPLPDRLDGLRVLDVGAWDGYWTFEALARGACEVVALDDLSDRLGFLSDAAPRSWDGFELCREALGLGAERCRRVDGNVYDVDEASLGRFDVVLCFGVLYHLRHPLLALDRLAAVCDGDLLVESAILDDFSPYRGGLGHGYADGQMVMELYPGAQYGNNPGNWWVPTLACLREMVSAAGFSDRCRAWKLVERPTELAHCRGFVRGSKPS